MWLLQIIKYREALRVLLNVITKVTLASLHPWPPSRHGSPVLPSPRLRAHSHQPLISRRDFAFALLLPLFVLRKQYKHHHKNSQEHVCFTKFTFL